MAAFHPLNPYSYQPPVSARGSTRAIKKSEPNKFGLTNFEELALVMEDVPGLQSDAMMEARKRAKEKIAAK